MLSTHADHVNEADYQYDPTKVLDHCMWFLSRKVTLDHTYMPHDFSITVHRED
jgi:starvation-inducible outer membrane lipoprotein